MPTLGEVLGRVLVGELNEDKNEAAWWAYILGKAGLEGAKGAKNGAVSLAKKGITQAQGVSGWAWDVATDPGKSKLRPEERKHKSVEDVVNYLDEHFTVAGSGEVIRPTDRPLIVRELPNDTNIQLGLNGRTLLFNRTSTKGRAKRKEDDGNERMMVQVSQLDRPQWLRKTRIPLWYVKPDWTPSIVTKLTPLVSMEEQERFIAAGKNATKQHDKLMNILWPRISGLYDVDPDQGPVKQIEEALSDTSLRWGKDHSLVRHQKGVEVVRGSSLGKDFYIIRQEAPEKKPDTQKYEFDFDKDGKKVTVTEKKPEAPGPSHNYFFAWKSQPLQPLISLKLPKETAEQYSEAFDKLLAENTATYHNVLNDLVSHKINQNELANTAYMGTVAGGVAGYHLGRTGINHPLGTVRGAYGGVGGALTTSNAGVAGRIIGHALTPDVSNVGQHEVMKNTGTVAGWMVGAATAVPAGQFLLDQTWPTIQRVTTTVRDMARGVFVDGNRESYASYGTRKAIKAGWLTPGTIWRGTCETVRTLLGAPAN